MSEILPTIELAFAELRSNIQAAWPDVKKVFEEKPREEVSREDWPYAVIDMDEVDEGWEQGGTAAQVAQSLTFKISLREAMPGDQSLLRYKAGRFDALTSYLMPTGGQWAQFGYYPYVPKRRFNEATSDPLEDHIEISLDFRVMFAVDYH